MADAGASPLTVGPFPSHPAPPPISVAVRIEYGSPWFSGHFPGEPVLPGIAQIEMVHDAIRRSCGHDLSIAGLSRVKFKHLVRPGDLLLIQATPDVTEKGLYSFRITAREREVCSGTMKVKRKDE